MNFLFQVSLYITIFLLLITGFSVLQANACEVPVNPYPQANECSIAIYDLFHMIEGHEVK